MAKIEKHKIHKILVVRTDRMGDVLLNIPAVRALKQSFNAAVVALVDPLVEPLLGGAPEIDQILIFDARRWRKSLLCRLRLFWQIRRMRFDLAVILNPSRRFHLLSYLAGIRFRLGYDRKWGFLLTHKIVDRKSQGRKHEVEYNLDLVRAIGADTEDKHISISTQAEDTQFVAELFKQNAISDQDLVVALHPHASNPAKCWPRQNFADLADRLKVRSSVKVVIIGGAEEREPVVELRREGRV